MTIRVIGIDIGGANLKAATWNANGQTDCLWQSFPLWKQPEELGAAVHGLIERLAGTSLAPIAQPLLGQSNGSHAGPLDGVPWLAITMTGELADCYQTRREGVCRILEQIASVHPLARIKVYAVGGRWLTTRQAAEDPWRVAASNWHALASWLVQWPPCCHQSDGVWERAVVVDIGSTTVDILPIVNGQLISNARTDRDRLERKQLVYTGMQRTAVCAMKSHFLLDGKTIPVMSELFATSDDAYLTLGLIEEQVEDCITADGRPRTAAYARARLARMIGEDIESLAEESIIALALQTVEAQSAQVADAMEENCKLVCQEFDRTALELGHVASGEPMTIVATGHGKPLLERACQLLRHSRDVRLINLADHELTEAASRCAPAAAAAWLLEHDNEIGHKADVIN